MVTQGTALCVWLLLLRRRSQGHPRRSAHQHFLPFVAEGCWGPRWTLGRCHLFTTASKAVANTVYRHLELTHGSTGVTRIHMFSVASRGWPSRTCGRPSAGSGWSHLGLPLGGFSTSGQVLPPHSVSSQDPARHLWAPGWTLFHTSEAPCSHRRTGLLFGAVTGTEFPLPQPEDEKLKTLGLLKPSSMTRKSPELSKVCCVKPLHHVQHCTFVLGTS